MGQLYWLISIPRLFPMVVKLSGWGRWPNPWFSIASFDIILNISREYFNINLLDSNPFQYVSSDWSHLIHHLSSVQETVLQSWALCDLPYKMSDLTTIFSSVFASNLSHSILRDWPDILISLQHSAWVMLNTGFSLTWKLEELVRRSCGKSWHPLISDNPSYTVRLWRPGWAS